METPWVYLKRKVARLDALYGRGQVISIAAAVFVVLLLGLAIALSSAAPTTITITSGPKGSMFEKVAQRYKELLSKQGVRVKILPSEGSMDNLAKLSDPKVKVDVGFVQAGEANGAKVDELVSLGSISYQPLMVFYRGKAKHFLSDFKGQRLDIGEEGSGAYRLARALLKANGVGENDGTAFVSTVSGDLVQALRDGRVDAIFLMTDATSTDRMRELLHTPDVHLFSFVQADAYTRRISYLNKLVLPEGALDFGKNIPSENVYLIAPTVELVARKNLHPALSDLLLEAAREVHGAPGIFKTRGEFPAPLEDEFRISDDAKRYYTSGKSFLYRSFPFWIATLISRVAEVVVPVALLLLPALKITPTLYRWRMESRINRWYRVLLELEREAAIHAEEPGRREEFLRHLDYIERTVDKIPVPAAFGSLFYGLREHIGFVRGRLLSQEAP